MLQQEMIQKLAASLGVAEEDARSLVEQEQKRIEAGKRYRQSEAYKRRLQMQKEVRKALKAIA